MTTACRWSLHSGCIHPTHRTGTMGWPRGNRLPPGRIRRCYVHLFSRCPLYPCRFPTSFTIARTISLWHAHVYDAFPARAMPPVLGWGQVSAARRAQQEQDKISLLNAEPICFHSLMRTRHGLCVALHPPLGFHHPMEESFSYFTWSIQCTNIIGYLETSSQCSSQLPCECHVLPPWLRNWEPAGRTWWEGFNTSPTLTDTHLSCAHSSL